MLPPGDYVLKVRCLDGFNDSNPIELSYPFHIAPYFYETSWFIIFTSILIILLIYFFIKLRTKRHSKRQLEENKINNTILELKLKAIQSKMNPHFIFNSLNNVISEAITTAGSTCANDNTSFTFSSPSIAHNRNTSLMVNK